MSNQTAEEVQKMYKNLTGYKSPNSTGLNKEQIKRISNTFHKSFNYNIKDNNIENIINCLDGEIQHYSVKPIQNNTHGYLFIRKESNFEIWIPSNIGRLDKQFIIAHGLGHYILHSVSGETSIKAKSGDSKKVEWEANYFAGNFLVPEDILKKEWATEKNINLLANTFNVSIKILTVRLEQTGLLI